MALVLGTLVLVASSTGASNTGVSTSATVLVAPVLATMVLVAGSTGATSTRASSTGATFLKAPMLLTMCYKHQCSKYCPKISTGLEKLAPTGWHVFATLPSNTFN